jgi:MOSC domain-containing protein YiiM
VKSSATRGPYYVLEPGSVAAGDAIEVVARPAHGVSVADAVRARFGPYRR